MYRKDRNITAEMPAYRRMLAHITPLRNTASVTFSQSVDLSRTLPWLRAHSTPERKLRLLHLYLAATARVLHERPQLNRYCTGARFYQRDGVHLSVSAKKQLQDGAKVVLLKLDLPAEVTTADVAARLAAELEAPRRGDELTQEKENRLLLMIPGPLLGSVVRFAMWLDRWHLLPALLADPDPLFSSMVVANLGSIGLDRVNHHLYEWGNCPLFAVIGRIEGERVQVEYRFDERVEDGLACAVSLERLQAMLEDPEAHGL